MEYLESMTDIQHEFDEYIIEKYDLDDLDDEDWIQQLCKAIRHELVEIEQEIDWKWWDDKEDKDDEAIKMEAIDIFLFTLSLLDSAGFESAEEIYATFLKKMSINYDRQEESIETPFKHSELSNLKSKVVARDLLQNFDTEFVSDMFKALDHKTLHFDANDNTKTRALSEIFNDIESPDKISEVFEESDMDYSVPNSEDVEAQVHEMIAKLLNKDGVEAIESGKIRVSKESVGEDIYEINVQFIAEESGMILDKEKE